MEYIKYSTHQIHLILQELINTDPGVIQPNHHTILPTRYLKRPLIPIYTNINEQRFNVNSCQRQGRSQCKLQQFLLIEHEHYILFLSCLDIGCKVSKILC